MVTKSKNADTKKTGKVKVDKLKLKKETVRDLPVSEKKGVRGGGSGESCHMGGCRPTL